MDLLAQIQARAKMTFWNKRDPLDVQSRAATLSSSARIRGTTYSSHFMYNAGVEDTYIRGGLATSDVYIGDLGRNVAIGNASAIVYLVGNFGAWTNLTYGTGWADFGSGFQGGQFRKIGDLVFLRGLVARTSGVGTTIATLPSLHRPPATIINDVNATDAIGRIDIASTGVMALAAGTPTYVNLSDIPPFSII